MNTSTLTRRDFVTRATTGALAGRGLLAAAAAPASAVGPQVATRSAARPVVIASANGNRTQGADGLTCVAKAYQLIMAGTDVLEALIAGVNVVERDPEDTGVGYGGLPNADGVVQLDASVMHGPLKRAGAVACLEGVRTPSLVAQAVMNHTDHHLLVGRDAQQFARKMGFAIEDDLNTDTSRRLWLEWKRRIDPLRHLDPNRRAEAGRRAGRAMLAEGLLEAESYHGTINCNGINAGGDICGVTTTSGLAFKIPGRVGDSPILGAGLYVDGAVGAAGSTGRGEANLFSLCSFLVVEAMRGGTSPLDAGMLALKRIVAATGEKRLLNERGHPNFNVSFYALNRRGESAGVSLYASRYALCDENGPQTLPTEPLLSGTPAD
jgi:N4-(beta-N-acetylglucosaminyl)-L-asparaginase